MLSQKPLVHSLCTSRLFVRSTVYVPTWFAPITSNNALENGRENTGFGWITIGIHTCIIRVYFNSVGNSMENLCINPRNRPCQPVVIERGNLYLNTRFSAIPYSGIRSGSTRSPIKRFFSPYALMTFRRYTSITTFRRSKRFWGLFISGRGRRYNFVRSWTISTGPFQEVWGSRTIDIITYNKKKKNTHWDVWSIDADTGYP